MATLIEHDLANILQTVAQSKFRGTLISVTKVRVTPDLGLARAYLSVFPSEKSKEVDQYTKEHHSELRNKLGHLEKNQLRVIPELEFYIDDSLDYIDNIDNLLKGKGENPIK